jgi:hypothetical protein
MKKLIIALLLASLSAKSQETVIAVWDFDGSNTEISGGTLSSSSLHLYNLAWLTQDFSFDGIGDDPGDDAITISNTNGLRFSGGLAQGLSISGNYKVNLSIAFNSWKISPNSNSSFQIRFRDDDNKVVGSIKLQENLVDGVFDGDKTRALGNVYDSSLQAGSQKAAGHFGSGSLDYSTPVTIGLSLNFVNDTYSYWTESPNSPVNGKEFNYDFSAISGNMPTSLAGVIIDNIQFGVKAENDDFFTIDQIKISTEEYSSTPTPPVTKDINRTIATNNSTDIKLFGTDANLGDVLTYSIITAPSNGSYSLDDNIVTYTPNTDFTGTDTFTYIANDGTFDSNESTITINVYNTPDISLSIDKNQIGEHDTATITASLSNPGPYDVEIDFSSVSGTASTDDYNLFSEAGGVRYIKFEAYYSSDDGQVNLNKIKAFTKDGTNVACGKSGYANSYQWGGWSSNGSVVTNCNDVGGRWSSDRNDPGPDENNPHYIVVDLEQTYSLDRIEIVGDGSRWTMSFSVLVSSDEQNWQNLGTFTNVVLETKVYNDISSDSFTIKSGETSTMILVKGIEDGITEGDEVLTITPQVTNANLISASSFSIDILDVVTSFTLKEDMFVGFNNASFAWGDYDLDGDFDVAIMGDKGNGLETLIYLNDEDNGVRQFVNSNQNFEKIGYGTLKWVDLNKDGYIDLFVSGLSQATGLPTSILYENKTDGLVRYFEENTSYSFPDLLETQVDFGDLDSDGDIDYIISGYDNNQQAVSFIGYQTDNGFELKSNLFSPFVKGDLKIFDADSDGDNDIITSSGSIENSYLSNSNNLIKPNSFFQKVDYLLRSGTNDLHYISLGGNDTTGLSSSVYEMGISARNNGDFTIGDFNNDGIEDIFITGENTNNEGESTLHIGEIWAGSGGPAGAAVYNPSSNFIFPGLKNASCQWVDYDNDGDLDLFLAGLKTGEGVRTYLYEVEITNKKNVAPKKIASLSSEHLGNGNVQLSWEAPSDDFSAILGYNVRLGTTPGGDELSYLLSDVETGRLLVNQTPSIFNTFYKIQLDPGVYYWSVQTVDKGFKASEFSEEQTLTLTYDWKILNQGGIENKSIPARNTPILEFLDLDNDNDFDLIYGQSGRDSKVFSYNQRHLLENNNYNFSYGIQDFEIGDINNDGSLDVIGRKDKNQNQVYLSGLNSNESNALTNRNFNTNELFERNQKVADLNNDGILEIINVGITSENEYFARFNMFSSNLDAGQNNFITQDMSSNFSVVSQMFAPSFDIGDFDNDQDVDVIISGDLIFGENITKIFENTTVAGSNEITFIETNDNIPGVKDGSTNFIDFDSDGDLDILLSGKDNVDNDVFDLYLNSDSGDWPKVETNLPAMKDTQLDMGDFNGDGLMDVLISGTTDSGKITKLLEYKVGEGFVESNYDLTDFIDAKFGFGDLDGDNDLDFVISGTNPSNNQPIFRVYLNYRSESADVINSQGSQISPSARSFSVFSAQSQEIQTSYVKNQPPSIPGTPSVSYLDANSSKTIVEINWSASNDDTTPSTAISYALKLGTFPGTEDVISSGSSDNGFRKYARKGNAEHNTSWKVALKPGKYYASVQAIDASYIGSSFSNERVLEVNQDGTLSIDGLTPGFNVVYPNPAIDQLHISLSDNVSINSYSIYDLLGRVYNLKSTSNNDGATIDIELLEKGYYMLEVNLSNGFKKKEKFIKL